MPSTKDFVTRIEILDECLRNRLRNWTLGGLINKVNDQLEERFNKRVSKRTIQADLKYLIEQKNAPVQKRRSGNETFYYYSDSKYSVLNLPVSTEDLDRLTDAINILRQVASIPLLKEVDDILERLKKTFDDTQTATNNPIIQFESNTRLQGIQFLDPLYSAIKLKQPLRIKYKSFSDPKPWEFVCHPYLLKEYRNRWFLIGRRNDSYSVTTLAIDRIMQIKNCSGDFRENDIIETEKYFDNIIGVSFPSLGTVEEIIFRANQVHAPYLISKPIHKSQKVLEEYKSGEVKLSIKVVCNPELETVLLGFGEGIEIISPEHLRNRIFHRLKQASNLY